MSALGSIAIYLAFGAGIWAVGASFYGARTGNQVAIRSGEGALKAAALSLTVAAGALWTAILQHDFSIAYIQEYTSRALPLFYQFGAFWAGQAGSILLWAWMLSIYATVLVFQNRWKNRDLMPWVSTVLGSSIVLFTFLMAFAGTNPFAKAEFVTPDGQGLNPLLQNYSQMFHPVTIYTGFVGLAVPFAFCIAALASGRLDDRWIRQVRGWTIWAWLFLGTGIILGGRWAYIELGWGGYWAWDPVENASLMPWLIATAFLHSVMIQEKKGMLKVWNVSLAVGAYVMSLFGTFLTRSGVVQSVHAFAQSSVGPYLIVGIVLTVAVSGALIVYRLPELRSKAVIESPLSREGTFLLNNLLFVAIAFSVFVGTTWPLVAEAVKKVKISVGPPWFNTIISPMAALLILLTGLCPLLAWRKASKKNLKRNFIVPVVSGALTGVILFVLADFKHWGLVIVAAFSVFVMATLVTEFYRGLRARRRIKQEGAVHAFGRLFTTNPRRYAGYVIHLGVIVLLLGVAINTAYKSDDRTTIAIGQSHDIADTNYTVQLVNLKEENTDLKSSIIGDVKVTEDGKDKGTVTTIKALYQNQDQPTTEVGILPSLQEDLYIILESADSATGTASLRFIVNPGIFWVWLGALLMIIGGVLTAMFGRNKEVTRETAEVYAAQSA